MIIFFGPAGSGKSMQGKLLATSEGWQWLSTGKMLRDTNDPLIFEQIDAGNLVASDLLYPMIEKVIDDLGSLAHIILDGFPRRREQAEWLVAHSSTKERSVEIGIIIDVPVEEIIARMLSRGRADDTMEAIQERLRIYHEEMEPILDYLAEQHIPMVHIDGIGSPEQVHERVVRAVRAAGIA
jgi:adenylate kinase